MIGRSIVPVSALCESDLVLAAQEGNGRAVEHLITAYEPICKIVRSLMYKLDRTGLHHDDLQGAANIGILRALPNYDASQETSFSSYAFYYVRGEMLKTLYLNKGVSASRTAPKMRLVSIDAPSPSGDGEAYDYSFERGLFARDADYGADPGILRVLNADRDAAVRSFVSRLSDGQRDIVVDLFWRAKTTTDIARERNVSSPAVSRAMNRVYGRGRGELATHQQALAA
jgi:RNA polymerase sigma factor (sigma-70 family)